MSDLPPKADMERGGMHVRFALCQKRTFQLPSSIVDQFNRDGQPMASLEMVNIEQTARD
jgi:hypothetical protein